MKWILLWFVLIIPFIGNAQYERAGVRNPGFMGKHIIISGNLGFSGSAFIMKEYWVKYGGSTEFILGQNFGLGFSFLHYSSNTSRFPQSNDCYDYPSFKFNTNRYGLDFYFYPKGVAPLGDYINVQLAYLSNYSDNYLKDGILKPGVDPYSCQDYSTNSVSSYNIGISVTYGKKRIFFNSLIVSYGVEFGMTLYNPLTLLIAETRFDPYNDETLHFLEATSYENAFSSLITLKGSVGIIW